MGKEQRKRSGGEGSEEKRWGEDLLKKRGKIISLLQRFMTSIEEVKYSQNMLTHC